MRIGVLLHVASLALVSVVGVPLSSDGPCDVYAKGNTPCVAAHSLTRALYSSYAGPLYNVMRMSDQTSKDIYVKNPGGVSDAAAQDTFCGNVTCIVQRIYDQTPMQNHLGIEHGASNLHPPRNAQDLGVNFTDARSKVRLNVEG